MRVPLPGETVYSEHTMGVLSFSLDQRSLRLPQPVKWTVCIEARSVFTISFDGKRTPIVILPSAPNPLPPDVPKPPSISNPAKGSIGAFLASLFSAIFKRK